MKRFAFVLVGVLTFAGMVADMTPVSGQSVGGTAPIYGFRLPDGYRDWRFVSMAHEEGTLYNFRAILGNDVAIEAFREGISPFPDGTIIARLAWS